MSVFDIDYDVLVWQTIPGELQDIIMFRWLKALVSQVVYQYDIFLSNRANNLYVLAHSSQVCYMQAVLNDTFDSVDRGITITDGPYKRPVYVYLISEAKPVYVGLISEAVPLYGYLISESIELGYQFIVNVPVAVESLPGYSEAWLRSVIDEYRLPGKGYYQVVYF